VADIKSESLAGLRRNSHAGLVSLRGLITLRKYVFGGVQLYSRLLRLDTAIQR
jgi:hypothetical protein